MASRAYGEGKEWEFNMLGVFVSIRRFWRQRVVMVHNSGHELNIPMKHLK